MLAKVREPVVPSMWACNTPPSSVVAAISTCCSANPINTGLGTGLDKTVSDYVGRVAFQPNQFYTLSSRFRFDSETFALQRLELEASTNFDRWNVSILYGDYAAQPQ